MRRARKRISVAAYLRQPETLQPQELAYGILREPPAPDSAHQSVVTRLGALLDDHVRRHRLGRILVSPIDVVLDRERALVVQPDVLFVSRARAAIIRERVWGAPDVVVEVLSWSTARHDRTVKLEWYRRYGTREGWLVDPIARRVEVLNLEKSTDDNPHVYVEGDTVRSDVLCSLALQVSDLFEE